MNSAQIKKARLDAIKDEVDQLHPLLKLLLPKLPRVAEVEHTHGTNEMGADFVFSRTEEIFGDIEYVGVIAKIGKIQQNYSDLERQIKECEIERFFKNGKRKIFLSEIVVVATGTISNGAQQKIYNDYKTRKILFVDGDRLSSLIDKHLPNFWTDVDLEVGDYLYSIWSRVDHLDRSLSLMPSQADRFYIEQDLYEVETYDAKHPKKPRRVDIHEQIERNNAVFIEGGMGAGKSKLLRNLISHYASPHQFINTNLIPVYTTFKEFYDTYGLDPVRVVEALIPEKVQQCKSDDARYLLFVDGADEKDLPGDELADFIISAADAARMANIKLVVTSRWNEGFERSASLPKAGKRVELVPLSTNRLIEFIRKLCGNLDIKSRLIEDLKKSSIFKELPKSPIAAILLAQLLNDNSKDLPSNLTELYLKYTDLSLGRWDIDKGLQTQKEFEALSTVVMEIAEYLLTNQMDVITIEEAQGFFERYLKKRNLGVSANDLYDRLTNRCDLVLADDSNGTFRFKHKTFKEFFYAKAHLKKPLAIDNRVWSTYWSTSYYFYVGLQKDCPELLTEIVNVIPEKEPGRWMRLVNLPNYLLAGFASPYEVTESALSLAMEEASELYYDISDGKIQSPFAIFSRMHLFWLMQIMIRKGYAFDFFEKAIGPSALAISDRKDDPARASLATFFLSAIAREINKDNKDCFDFLIDHYRGRMPNQIELAIKHETEDDKHRSNLVKKLTQKVGRALKTNTKLRQYVDSLYKTPIKMRVKKLDARGSKK